MFFQVTAVALLSAISASAETHTIQVGMGGLTFNPATITAKKGDDVSFQFMAKNHTVSQSTFGEPCKLAPQGADSGFQAIPQGQNMTADKAPTWTFTVENDTAPLWFYCKQKTPVSHCAMGMVFSINPTQEKSHDAFVAKAKESNSTAGASGSGSAAGGASATGGASSTGDAAASSSSSAAAQAALGNPNGARTVMAGGAATALAIVGVLASLV